MSESTLFGFPPQMFLACAVGCAGALFKLCSQGSRPRFLERIDSTWNRTGHRIADIALWLVLGSVLGTVVLQPGSYTQAVVAGLGWTGILGLAPTVQES